MEKKLIILGVGVVAVLILIVAVPLGVMFWPLKPTFIDRCKELNGYDCETWWGAFEQAYVGKDPRKVHMEDYDNFIKAVNFSAEPNKLMFWSKTKDVVHAFTKKKKDCFLTVEDTALGYMLDGLMSWCGKEGCTKTFRKIGCPGWKENNAVGSFWNRVSAAFADAARGDVTAMLNGDIDTPFNPNSTFATIEVKRFDSPKVKSLTVVLVTGKSAVTNCKNASLKDLQRELKKGIAYNCKEVTEAQLEECSSNPERPCGACW
ncbi:ADP-ribosyl cyclase/cyclic ADP-ribose hydrolase 1-like [Perca flavescens]|uniref:ADP-ribosyl cyclase/cyclic ADP-ribose hydrolase 1-like n=1 Tax=Perca flavescens TaxID=8167 RepID=UPI00106E7FF0|nr:ADP-ribosyl cyclase/cyclic ADP-ribose hydrolase 1-like [Perca flavescens]